MYRLRIILIILAIVVLFSSKEVFAADAYQGCFDREQSCLRSCGEGSGFSRTCGERCEEQRTTCNKKVTQKLNGNSDNDADHREGKCGSDSHWNPCINHGKGGCWPDYKRYEPIC